MSWVGYATPQAKRIVMDIFRYHIQNFAGPSSEALLSSRQIYESAIRDCNEPTKSFVPKRPESMTHKKKNGRTVTKSWPPNDEHPIRSMKYLKQVVLKDFDDRGLIEKVHHRRPPNVLGQTPLGTTRKIIKQNERQVVEGSDSISVRPEDMVSEWLWRVRSDAGKRWTEEEKLLTKLEDQMHRTHNWPDKTTQGIRDPYDLYSKIH